MNWDTRKHYYPPIILINSHLCGLFGLLSSWKTLFLWLTPFSLVLSAALVFIYQPNFNRRFYLLAISLFLLGFFAEVSGVATGLVFGNYSYGKTLGFMWLNVPLVMGLNWLILIYCMGSFLNRFPYHNLIKSFIGAGVLMTLDLFIEQVAIRYDFWHWQHNIIPIQNFVAWFVLSFVFLMLYYTFLGNTRNRLAAVFLGTQFLFFGGIVLFH